MSFNEDALTFVDSAAIQYPELNQVIIEMTMPNLISKRLLTDDVLKRGQNKNLPERKRFSQCRNQ